MTSYELGELRAGICLEDFNLLATIGKGIFAKIALAEKEASKALFAIKFIRKGLVIENEELSKLMMEKNMLSKATQERHPFIVRLDAFFQTETRLCLVLEYVSGGDLMFHLQKGPFGTKRAQFYAAEVCLALKWFHERHILYRNLQLDNILLGKDGHIKIVGFGFCKESMLHRTKTRTFCGTQEFMAPEILLDKGYGLAVGWWAFGVIVYQMLLQKSPFYGKDEDEIYNEILRGEPLYPMQMPRDSRNLIEQLLVPSPEQRLGSGPKDAFEIMRHPFFEYVNWDDLYNERIPVPFVPVLQSDTDVSNFDGEVTSLTPALTPVQSLPSPAMQEQLRGFSEIISP